MNITLDGVRAVAAAATSKGDWPMDDNIKWDGRTLSVDDRERCLEENFQAIRKLLRAFRPEEPKPERKARRFWISQEAAKDCEPSWVAKGPNGVHNPVELREILDGEIVIDQKIFTQACKNWIPHDGAGELWRAMVKFAEENK